MGPCLRFVIVVLACLATACATRGYAPVSGDDTRELRIGAGAEISVVTTDRERLSFKVTQVLPDRFAGVTVKSREMGARRAGITVEVPYADIALLEVTRFDARAAAKTGAIVVLTVGLAALVLSDFHFMPNTAP